VPWSSWGRWGWIKLRVVKVGVGLCKDCCTQESRENGRPAGIQKGFRVSVRVAKG
jgi:hypothetical protein